MKKTTNITRDQDADQVRAVPLNTMNDGERVTKKQLDDASRWLDLDDTGIAAKTFKAAIEAGGLLTEDVMRVCAAIDALLKCGLERRTLAHLVVMKGPTHKGGGSRHGNPVLNVQTVLDVFTALENMPTHLVEQRKGELTKRVAAVALPPKPDGLTDAEWKSICAARAAK